MDMPKYIRFDYAAKRLLRQKANFVVLEGFLTVLLKTNVKIQRMLESESNQEHEDDKFNRVDMLAELGNGELAIIEIQNSRVLHYFQRILYGTSKAITEYIDIGDEYSKVKKVYSVSIVYFGLGQGNDYAYHGKTEFRGINKTDDVLRLSQKQQEQFKREFAGDLYPEYFILRVDDFDDVAKSSLEEWISFLKNGDIPDSFTAPGLREARERLLEAGMSREERMRYNSYMDAMRNARSVISTYFMEGEDKGRKEGRIEGKEEGVKEGEEKTLLKAINKMLSHGKSAEEIAELLDIPLERVRSLLSLSL